MAEATIIDTPDSRRGGRMALLAEFWSYFKENRGAVTGLVFFVCIVIVALFADFIALHAPTTSSSATPCCSRHSGRTAVSCVFLSAPMPWEGTSSPA